MGTCLRDCQEFPKSWIWILEMDYANWELHFDCPPTATEKLMFVTDWLLALRWFVIGGSVHCAWAEVFIWFLFNNMSQTPFVNLKWQGKIWLQKTHYIFMASVSELAGLSLLSLACVPSDRSRCLQVDWLWAGATCFFTLAKFVFFVVRQNTKSAIVCFLF